MAMFPRSALSLTRALRRNSPLQLPAPALLPRSLLTLNFPKKLSHFFCLFLLLPG